MSKWMEKKKLEILLIKEKINENKDIKLIFLISKLTVEEPFMSRERAIKILEDLRNAGQINVNQDGAVSVCQ